MAPVGVLVDDGAVTFAVVARPKADTYRAPPGDSRAIVACVRARSEDLQVADLGRVPSLGRLPGLSWDAGVAGALGFVRAPERAWVRPALGVLGVLFAMTVLAWYVGSMVAPPSKTSEATRRLGDLETALKRYAAEHQRFPVSGGPVPATPPRGKFVVPAAAWAVPPWSDLGFSISQPHYYQYQLETSADGQRCWVRARGDLDENGVMSLFELEVRIDATGALKRERLRIENEDE